MEEYVLCNQWICEADWNIGYSSVKNTFSYRSKNFGPEGRKWFLCCIYERDKYILELYREEISEPVEVRGFAHIRGKNCLYYVTHSEINCRMNAGVIKTTIASLKHDTVVSYGIIDITCGLFVTKIVERDEKSAQSGTEYAYHNNIQEIPTLNDTRKLPLTPIMKYFSNLSRDMQVMYDRHDYSDIILECNSLEFRAHKCVLSARSPMFAHMFRHTMTETTHDRMLITDMDAEILEKLLLFMYSGQANPSSYPVALDLYYAADKYAVYDLKDICREVIPSLLSTSTALETLILSDKHQDDNLMDKTLAFIASVFKEIKSTEAWATFLKENSSLGIKVLSFVVEQLYAKT